MKKRFLILVVMLISNAWIMAQIPDKVKSVFSEKYPGARMAEWKNDKNKNEDTYLVSFSDSVHLDHKIMYDKDGNVVRQKTELSTMAVLPAISTYYQTRTTGVDKYNVWEVKGKNGEVLFYETEMNGETTYFDKDGNVITEEITKNMF